MTFCCVAGDRQPFLFNADGSPTQSVLSQAGGLLAWDSYYDPAIYPDGKSRGAGVGYPVTGQTVDGGSVIQWGPVQLKQIFFNGYYSVDNFGARPDTAFQSLSNIFACARYANRCKQPAMLETGVYLGSVDGQAGVGPVVLNDGDTFVLHGKGCGSVLKRPDNDMRGRFTDQIEFEIAGHAEHIELRRFRVDSNFRGNPLTDPANPYEYEQSSMIKVRELVTDAALRSLHTVDIDEIWLDDPIADGLNIAYADNSKLINHTRIRRVFESGRNATRATIQLQAGCEVVDIENVGPYCGELPNNLPTRIETELTRDVDEPMKINIRDCPELGVLEFGGLNPELTKLTIHDVNTTDYTIFTLCEVDADDCAFAIAEPDTLSAWGSIRGKFNDCTLNSQTEPAALAGIRFFQASGSIHVEAEFTDCHFGTDGPTTGVTSAITVSPQIAPSGSLAVGDAHQISLRGCTFDEGFEHCVDAYFAGQVITQDNEFNCTRTPVRTGSVVNRLGGWKSCNDRQNTGQASLEILGGGPCVVDIAGNKGGDTSAVIGAATPGTTILSSRHFHRQSVPSGSGINGDTVVLSGTAANGFYRATADSDANAAWAAV